MTLPDERTRAVRNVKKFLYRLADPKATPRVPSNIRKAVWGLLRHYPGDFDLSRSAEKLPNVWGEPEDDDPLA